MRIYYLPYFYFMTVIQSWARCSFLECYFIFFWISCLPHFLSIHHQFIPKFSTSSVHPLVVRFRTLGTHMVYPRSLQSLSPTYSNLNWLLSVPNAAGSSVYHHPTGLLIFFTRYGSPCFPGSCFFVSLSFCLLLCFYRSHLPEQVGQWAQEKKWIRHFRSKIYTFHTNIWLIICLATETKWQFSLRILKALPSSLQVIAI